MELVVFLLVVTSLLVTSQAEMSGRCGDGDGVVVRGGRRQSDGSFLAKDGNRYPPGCYWKSDIDVISGCPGKSHPCLWKCCADKMATDTHGKCHNSNHPLLSTFQPPPNGTFDFSRYDLIRGIPHLRTSYEVGAETDHFTITENGSLIVDDPDDDNNDGVYMPGEFCRDVVIDKDGVSPPLLMYYEYSEGNENQTIEGGDTPQLKFLINGIGVLISVPFLLATLVVYAVIPELRNLHGKCLMSHVASLCVTFVCLALLQLGVDLLSLEGCIATGMIGYCFFLASFFWLNVMCFDIWWTFSGYRSSLGPKDPRDKQKFVYYSLYAWGAALIFLCVCVTMQFKEDIPKEYVKPDFGEYSCWFHDERALWAYFYGPVAVLILCNLIFFALTALSLWKIKRQTAVLNEGQDSQRNSNTKAGELRFKLYLKLFIVMGVPWTMEIISSAVGGPEYIWWLTDLANLLVGIPIFIIFVWKSKVRQLFLAKLNIKTGSSTDTSAYELT